MNPSNLKIGTIVSYLSIAVKAIVMILYTPIMIKLLGNSEYGLYQLAYSFVGYLGILSFGFGGAYMRFFAKSGRNSIDCKKNSIGELNGLFLILFLLIALFSLFAGVAIVINSDYIFGAGLTIPEQTEMKILLSILLFNISLSFPSILFSSYLIANERFVFVRVLDILETIFNPFLALPLLLMGFKSPAIAWVILILSVLKLICSIYYCFKRLHMEIAFKFSRDNFYLLKDVSIFSSFLFINIVTDQLNWNIDKYIIGRVCDTTQVAIYSIGAQFNYYFLLLPSVLSNIFTPRVNVMVANGASRKDLSALFISVGRLHFFLIGYILIGFVFLGKYFIEFWVGDSYYLSYYVAVLLMLPSVIELIQKLGDEIQKAYYLHKFRAFLYFFIAVINVIISIPLTVKYGVCGSAFGTSLSVLLAGIIMNFYNKYKIGLNTKLLWKQIFSIVPSFAIVAFIMWCIVSSFMIYSWASLFIIMIIYSFLFLFVNWLFALNMEEKKILKSYSFHFL